MKKRSYGMSGRFPPGFLVSIYIIECIPYVKIGIAVNPEGRLAALRIGNPHDLVLQADFKVRHEVAASAEHIAHLKLASCHHRDEWFACDAAVATPIVVHSIEMAEADWSQGRLAHEFEAARQAAYDEADRLKKAYQAEVNERHRLNMAEAKRRYEARISGGLQRRKTNSRHKSDTL